MKNYVTIDWVYCYPKGMTTKAKIAWKHFGYDVTESYGWKALRLPTGQWIVAMDGIVESFNLNGKEVIEASLLENDAELVECLESCYDSIVELIEPEHLKQLEAEVANEEANGTPTEQTQAEQEAPTV